MKYKHLKTGNLYQIAFIVTNSTNGDQEGRPVVIYFPERFMFQFTIVIINFLLFCITKLGHGPIYCRDEEEFDQKFEKIEN